MISYAGSVSGLSMGILSHASLLVIAALLCATEACAAAEPSSELSDELAFSTTTSGCKIGNPIKLPPMSGAASLQIKITWSGACIDGQVSGNGIAEAKVNDEVKWHYEGEMRNGVANGQGTAHLPGGVTISGVWQDAMIDGPVVASIEGGLHYEGGWKIDRREGHGVETFPDGTRFEGDWHDGQREGHGILKKPNGGSYDGNWHAGTISGFGISKNPDGSTYEGEFQRGKRNGHGTQSSGSSHIEADWEDDVPDGHVSITDRNGSHYEGEFHDWKMNGRGTMVTLNGARYVGEWRDGFVDGQGTLVRPDTPPFSGTWKHGCFQDGDRSIAFGVKPSSCLKGDATSLPHQ